MTLTEEQKKLFDALTPLQKNYVVGIIEGLNQTDAYINAGGKGKGDTARSKASRMGSNGNVKAFLDSVKESAVTEAVMTYQEALERLSAIARTSLYDLAEFGTYLVGEDDEGKPIEQTTWRFKNHDELNPVQIAAISELTAGKDGLKIKLHDPKAAIKQLAELQGWEAPKTVNHTSKDGSMTPQKSITDDELKEKLEEFGYGRYTNQLSLKECGDTGGSEEPSD